MMDWGNVVVVFNREKEDGEQTHQSGLIFTILHELAHSYDVSHTFDNLSKHRFYQGYTDNLLDYRQFKVLEEELAIARANNEDIKHDDI